MISSSLSLTAAERRRDVLRDRLVIFAGIEPRSRGAGRFAGPGGGVAAKSAVLDAPLRPLRQQPERGVGVVGDVAVADEMRRHLDTVRRAGVERTLVRTLTGSPLAEDCAQG